MVWNITFEVYNESKQLGFGIYNLLFFIILAGVVSSVFDEEQREISYVLRSVCVGSSLKFRLQTWPVTLVARVSLGVLNSAHPLQGQVPLAQACSPVVPPFFDECICTAASCPSTPFSSTEDDKREKLQARLISLRHE
jgi:hypothetical protein